MNLGKYAKIWTMAATQEYQRMLATKVSAMFFFIGKAVRFVMFLLILLLLKQNTKSLVGYSFDTVIIFFLTFNFIDTVSQMFFRGVYQVSGKIRSGELDGYLAKPINVLFRLLTGAPDLNDLLIFIPMLLFSWWYIAQSGVDVSFFHLLLYLLFLFNGFVIAMAFHIFVICFGILTTEVDNTIMLYRDLSQMGRFPVDIYREPLRWVITFVVPVGIMMNIPAQVLTGNPPVRLLIVATVIAVFFLTLSLKTWSYAVREYTSASS